MAVHKSAELAGALWRDIKKIRSQRVRVHIHSHPLATVWVAQCLAALGCCPIYTVGEEERRDLLENSDSIAIDLGSSAQIGKEALMQVRDYAISSGKPLVLDPSGIRLSSLRMQVAQELLQEGGQQVLRANAAELMLLNGYIFTDNHESQFVKSSEAMGAAYDLAEKYGHTVVVSGNVDIIVGPEMDQRYVYNGCSLMRNVIGMGSACSSIIAAFAAVNPNLEEAALHAMACVGLVSERIGTRVRGLGTFQLGFLDALSNLNRTGLEKDLKVESPPSYR